jgi:hypothetical protein
VAVTFDAVGPSGSGATTATSPLTWSHTDGGTADWLLAAVAVDGGATTIPANFPITAMTYGAASFGAPLLNWQSGGSGQNVGYLALYALQNPASGANTASATVTTGAVVDVITGGSLSFITGGGSLGTPVHADSAGAGVTSGSVTVPTASASSIVAVFVATGSGGVAFTSGTSRFLGNNAGFGNGAAATCAGATIAGTGGNVTVNWTQNSDFYAAIAVEILPPAGGAAYDGAPSGFRPAWPPALTRTFGPAMPFTGTPFQLDAAPQAQANAGLATGAGAALAAGTGKPYPAALDTSVAPGFWKDQSGHPIVVIGDEAWGLVGNAGRWGGTWQSDIDGYVTARAAQGYTAVEIDLVPSTLAGGLNDGATWDGVSMFNSGTSATAGDPSAGLNSTYWQRVDYLIAALARAGMTLFANILLSYDMGHALSGLTPTQFGAYGTGLGARYASTGNLQWMIEDDYFGTADSTLDTILTGIRAAGDTRPISIENYSESTSRKDVSNNSVLSWGTSNAGWQWCYSYNVAYFAVEYAYGEASPLPVIRGDGYYYKASGDEQLIRNHFWWALSSGSRGFFGGDDRIWQWQSGSAAAVTTGAWQTATLPAAAAAFAALPGWHKLIPDTGSAFILSGRGTRATSLTSGGGATAYSGTTDNYVSGSIAADATLAVIYCLQHFSVTIDQAKMAPGYTAAWMDPLTGALTSTAAGSAYNSTPLGNNSAGNPDWVLVLQAPTTVSAAAGLATGAAAAQQPSAAATATAGLAPGTGTAQASTTSAGSNAALAAGNAVAQQAVPAITVNAGLATSTGIAQQPAVSASGSTNAPAGLASAAGAALQPMAAGAVNAGLAAGSGAALQPVPATGVNAGLATGSGTALVAAAAEGASAGLATGTGTAQQPSVTTSGSTNAPAGLASAAGTTQQPVPAATAAAGLASAAGTAQAAGHGAIAGVATAACAALAPALTLTAQAHAAAAQAVAAALSATAQTVIPAVFGTATATGAPFTTATASGGGTVTATAGGQP